MHIQQLFPRLFQTKKEKKRKTTKCPFMPTNPFMFFFSFCGEGHSQNGLPKIKKQKQKSPQLPYYPVD